MKSEVFAWRLQILAVGEDSRKMPFPGFFPRIPASDVSLIAS